MTISRSLLLGFSFGLFVFSSVGISDLESPTMAPSLSGSIGASVTGNAAAGLSTGNMGAGAVAATHASAHAAHGASTAAQAIAASQQAAMMFKLLMAKGVMDYFQRKEMDKANEVLAQKMEKLQQELNSGKLNPAQYNAIKAAVEETYAKYSKTEPFKDKAIQTDSARIDKASKSSSIDSLSGSLGIKDDGSGKLGLQSGASDLAKLDAKSSELKNQTGKNLSSQDSTKAFVTNGSTNPAVGFLQTPGFNMMAGSQTPGQQSVSVQNSIQALAESKEKAQGGSTGRNPASVEFGGAGLDFRSDLEMSEGVPMGSADFEELDEHYSLLSGRTPASSHFGSSLQNLLNPIKFQKNPFSRKLQTEEGYHLGLLILLLVGVFFLGRKFNRGKKIPKVIPEVVLTPERRSHSKALVVKKMRRR